MIGATRQRNHCFILAAIAAVFLAPAFVIAQDEASPSGREDMHEVTPGKTDSTAQDSQAPDKGSGEGGPSQDAPPGGGRKELFDNPFMLVLLGGMMILIFWLPSRNRRKREAKHKEMLTNLKKGDKVTSAGGIIGTVIEVREDEATIKVDETNNVRMHFARWAIRGVGPEARDEKPGEGR